MKKAGLLIGIILLAIIGSSQAFAQSGRVEQYRNWLGFYKYRQGDQKFSEKAFMQIMPVNSDSYTLMRKARRNNVVGACFGGAAGFLAGSQLNLKNTNQPYSKEILFTGLGLFVVGVHFGVKYVKQSRLATDLYNQQAASSSFKNKPEFEIGLAGNGLGLKMKF